MLNQMLLVLQLLPRSRHHLLFLGSNRHCLFHHYIRLYYYRHFYCLHRDIRCIYLLLYFAQQKDFLLYLNLCLLLLLYLFQNYILLLCKLYLLNMYFLMLLVLVLLHIQFLLFLMKVYFLHHKLLIHFCLHL